MKDALIVSALSLVPRKTAARGMGWAARQPFSRLITRLFVRVYGVNLDEATGDLADYPTLEALFTRQLKPGLRPVDDGADAMVSPVDGTVAFVGMSEGGKIHLGARSLDIAALLDQPLDGECDVAVLYLSPTDYHRVHVPLEGTATGWSYVPGTLWPVFPAAVRKIEDLFAKNERLTVHLDTAAGPLHAVLVGAFGVGRITTPLCDIVTNTGGQAATGELSAAVQRGGPLGTFHLGSTVVLVAPGGTWSWELPVGASVRMGERIAHQVRRLTKGPL